MNNSTVNYTTTEAFTNPTTHFTGILDSLNICVYIISLLFGLPTHSYVTWLIITGTGRGVASKFFILNLSVCEIGISLYCFVYAISYWSLSVSTIKLFFVGLTITGRPLFQCLICVERYLAVLHPVTFLKYKPLRYRVFCCTVAWIICLGSCVFCMYILGEDDMHLYTWFFSLQFLFYLSIQLFCLVAVLRALKQSGPGERGGERNEENHMKRRAFHLILITTVSMAIIYGPYLIIGFLTIMIKQLIQPLWFIGLTCYVLAGFVHPLLHLHRAGKVSCLRLL
ncbi:uracil nucleotide/cysteinyl leukotriene receptor-like [Cyprinus carpio]|uniref:Uracil nucleotide/cysteinyl leukotriene receptor-like n=1 Tax=Cyprinus carpio TaxID=7962 RepID=A0A9Q9XKW0_CYPCA|nr:uracil nucleotide/cysteinyl leukotriene receptor-like [Cyprinus carpio]